MTADDVCLCTTIRLLLTSKLSAVNLLDCLVVLVGRSLLGFLGAPVSDGKHVKHKHTPCKTYSMYKSLEFGDEFVAQGLLLQLHQKCSAAFCRPVKFFHTD